MNRVSWFKGRMAAVRVTPYPLVPREMLRPAALRAASLVLGQASRDPESRAYRADACLPET